MRPECSKQNHTRDDVFLCHQDKKRLAKDPLWHHSQHRLYPKTLKQNKSCFDGKQPYSPLNWIFSKYAIQPKMQSIRDGKPTVSKEARHQQGCLRATILKEMLYNSKPLLAVRKRNLKGEQAMEKQCKTPALPQGTLARKGSKLVLNGFHLHLTMPKYKHTDPNI